MSAWGKPPNCSHPRVDYAKLAALYRRGAQSDWNLDPYYTGIAEKEK